MDEVKYRALASLYRDDLDAELADVPVQASGAYSVPAEEAAMGRVAERRTAESVAYARQNGMSWSWVGQQLGVTPQAAQQRFGKTPPPVRVPLDQHGPACAGSVFTERLRRDRTGWGCPCGAAGPLD
jgi:hypothetical protein